MEQAYCRNPYHNNLHAADVVQTCLHFLTTGGLIEATGVSPLATAGTCMGAGVCDGWRWGGGWW